MENHRLWDVQPRPAVLLPCSTQLCACIASLPDVACPTSSAYYPAGGELTVADLIAGLGDSKAKLGAARKVGA